LRSRQQGNLAHLRQVHAHGVVGPAFAVFVGGQKLVCPGIDIQIE
jgi:hypothetical protein